MTYRPPAPSALRPTPAHVRWWRTARVTVHLFEGLATTTLVFPMLRPPARRRLIRRWSGRLLRMLAVEARVFGELPSAGGNLLVVSNHVSWLDIFVLHSVQPVRFIAKSDLARWPLAGRPSATPARCSSSASGGATRTGSIARPPTPWRRATWSRSSPRARPPTARRCCRSRARCCSRSSMPRGTCCPWPSAIAASDGTLSTAPAYDGAKSIADSFRAIVRERRLVVELHLAAPLPASAMHRRELAQAAETAVRDALGLPAADRGTDPAAGPATASGPAPRPDRTRVRGHAVNAAATPSAARARGCRPGRSGRRRVAPR